MDFGTLRELDARNERVDVWIGLGYGLFVTFLERIALGWTCNALGLLC